jgi:nucleoside-diphosphate-sugar epimerase
MLCVVTGAQGFIGRRVVLRLSECGFRVAAVDLATAHEAVIPNVHYRRTDLSDPRTLLPPEMEPREEFVLIHLAWEMVRGDQYQPQAASVSCLASLLDEWAGKGLVHAVVFGSSEEYGSLSGRIREQDRPALPLSPYGWGKRAAYLMAASWGANHSIPVLWFRPFVIYGPGQSGTMLIPYAVGQALNGMPAQFSDGLQERDFVYVDDVVEAILLAVQKRPGGVQTVNLGCGEGVRIRDVVTELAQLFGAEELFRLGARQRRIQEPDIRIAEIARARDLLGWQPKVRWREGLRRLFESTARK